MTISIELLDDIAQELKEKLCNSCDSTDRQLFEITAFEILKCRLIAYLPKEYKTCTKE